MLRLFPSVCSSWADVLQKQSFFRGSIHILGLKAAGRSLLPCFEEMMFLGLKLEGKKTNSAGCFSLGLEKVEKQGAGQTPRNSWLLLPMACSGVKAKPQHRHQVGCQQFCMLPPEGNVGVWRYCWTIPNAICLWANSLNTIHSVSPLFWTGSLQAKLPLMLMRIGFLLSPLDTEKKAGSKML